MNYKALALWAVHLTLLGYVAGTGDYSVAVNQPEASRLCKTGTTTPSPWQATSCTSTATSPTTTVISSRRESIVQSALSPHQIRGWQGLSYAAVAVRPGVAISCGSRREGTPQAFVIGSSVVAAECRPRTGRILLRPRTPAAKPLATSSPCRGCRGGRSQLAAAGLGEKFYMSVSRGGVDGDRGVDRIAGFRRGEESVGAGIAERGGASNGNGTKQPRQQQRQQQQDGQAWLGDVGGSGISRTDFVQGMGASAVAVLALSLVSCWMYLLAYHAISVLLLSSFLFPVNMSNDTGSGQAEHIIVIT